jgi:DUF438 domain-containing protein
MDVSYIFFWQDGSAIYNPKKKKIGRKVANCTSVEQGRIVL